MQKKPLVSIITICYNAEELIEQTIKSVINQKSDFEYEYIVIDGGSSDGTVDLIHKYNKSIDYHISEKDNGIYDAMNKGITVAHGTWLNFMNAGDTFFKDDTLSKIKWKNYNNIALLYGNTYYRNQKIVYPPKNIKTLLDGNIFACHQSMFFNKKILKDNLKYRTDISLTGDSELVTKIYAKKYSLAYVDITISNYMEGGLSQNLTPKTLREIRIAKIKYLYHFFGIKGLINWFFRFMKRSS